MRLLYKFFHKKDVDEELKKCGFTKTEENKFCVSYERYNDEFQYVHCVELHLSSHKQSCFIMSYEKEINKDGFNNCVGLTGYEMSLILNKINMLAKQYHML